MSTPNSQEDFLANLNAFAPTTTSAADIPIDVFPVAPDAAYTSRTVSTIEDSSKPQKEVVCITCTSAMWFKIPSELRCFCHRMRMLSWQSCKPFPVVACDGWDDQPAEEK